MPLQQLKDKSLYYTRWTPKTPSPKLFVLFIHGLGSSHAFYAPIAAQLAADEDCDVIAYDTYGSGLSKSRGEAQSVSTMVQDAKDLLESLSIPLEHTLVVGHSLGGLVACALAATENPRGIVAIGPVYPNPSIEQAMLKRASVVEGGGLETLAEAIPSQATGSKASGLQKSFIRSLILSQTPEGYASLCRVIAGAEVPDYRQITAPVLIVAGEEDKVISIEHCREIVAQVKGDERLEILAGVGHWHCIEDGDAVLQLIRDFSATL